MRKPFFDENGVQIYCGDALSVLKALPAESVNCCVTSPPYYGLRDYGTATWEGGDPACDHKVDSNQQAQGKTSARAGRANVEEQRNENFLDICPKCGARRIDQQIGLEESPSEYVAKLVDVFREVRRVLRNDGTLWLNLGDSYAGSGKGAWDVTDVQKEVYIPKPGGREVSVPKIPLGLKRKDLIGVPWRVAFALQADGWYLRSDIIWHSPNKMPSSVTDRPTLAHEYVFLLAKSQRYYYDAAAIAEKAVGDAGGASFGKQRFNAFGTKSQSRTYSRQVYETRNARSVWTIPTASFHGAHFATFPSALARRCILAGIPKDGTVLDPFLGSGTTCLVAQRCGVRGVGIELNRKYCMMAARRLRKSGFLETAVWAKKKA